MEKKSTERVRKVVEEYEETSDHGYDNRKGDNHISGVYRWVDKIYDNKIVNYGKRLIYEFMIPEPATLHNVLMAQAAGNSDASNLKPPVDPRKFSVLPIATAAAVTPSRANYWASYFNVEVGPKPEDHIRINESFTDEKTEGASNIIHNTGEIEIPEGYKAVSGNYALHFNAVKSSGTEHCVLSLGDWKKSVKQSDIENTDRTDIYDKSESFPNYIFASDKGVLKSKIKYSYLGADGDGIMGNISIKCALTSQGLKQWQLETFKAIMDGYEAAVAIYEEKVAAINAQTQEKIRLNPAFYREIEKNVLKKNCLDYLLGAGVLGIKNLIDGDSVKRNADMENLTTTAQFFEQAFEWNIMSYQFYPFYWAHKNTWADKYTADNNDALFNAFLKSGMARVFLTVRPGFEAAINFYMATGRIWEGGTAPQIEDPEFISIAEDLENTESVIEETWTSRVPTSLTVIQAGTIGLNVDGLPCNPGCDENLFESDKNPIVQSNAQMGEGDADLQGQIKELYETVDSIKEAMNKE